MSLKVGLRLAIVNALPKAKAESLAPSDPTSHRNIPTGPKA